MSDDERPMHSKPLVYIAGPYTNPDPIVNTRNAILAGDEIMQTGLCVTVVPHLSLLSHLVIPHDLEWWYEYDLAILARCDALLRLPGDSSGADHEVEFADRNRITTFKHRAPLYKWLGRPR